MIYLASPYSSPMVGDAKLQAEAMRYRKAIEFVTFVALTGGPALFSPIVYYHPIAVANKMPTDAGYWARINFQYLRIAEGLFLLMLPGWDKSKGVELELNTAKMLGIPVTRFDADFKEVVEH